MKAIHAQVFRTALGWAGAIVTTRGVRAIVLPVRSREVAQRKLDRIAPAGSGTVPGGKELRRTVRLVERYCSGSRTAMDVPLDLGAGTAFQRAVWTAARGIPYGRTRSYGWIAKRIGRPKAARAVGQAMGANPVPLVIP